MCFFVEVFKSLGIKESQPIIVSCFKGLKAGVLGFVANLIGYEKVALYPVNFILFKLNSNF